MLLQKWVYKKKTLNTRCVGKIALKKGLMYVTEMQVFRGLGLK